MEGFFETITRGNVTEVKVVLASVVMALAGYQVFLIAIGYGKLRLRFLEPAPATRAHRAIGGTIVVVSLLVAAMCLAYFELDEAAVHAVVASALLAVLALKLVVVRWWHSAGRFLPLLGITVFVLFGLTWLTSAGDFLSD
ncbi:MAG: DUF6529 family protein [Solirubrobacterales bacterium]